MARIPSDDPAAPDAWAAVPADVRVVAAKRPATDVLSHHAKFLERGIWEKCVPKGIKVCQVSGGCRRAGRVRSGAIQVPL
jgi:hypothetical protein